MTEPGHLTQLLSRVSLRDRAAFQRLYEQTSPRLFAIALNMLGERAQAEDLLQEVFIKVWYAADTYSEARGEPMAWLVSMTRNRAIDSLRGRSSRGEPFGGDLDLVPEIDGATTPGETGKRMSDCLDELDNEQRQSIFAAFFQGLTHSEIAARFAEPIGTIKSRVRRGLLSLRRCLER